MKSNISQLSIIVKREAPALITYTVAGDNNKINSLILNSISKYADICELGFVHNCPIADEVKFKIVHIEL